MLSRISRPQVYITDAAESVLRRKTAQWVHVYEGIQVPPTGRGSYNYLLWDIMERRKSNDLLIAKYYEDSYKLASEANSAIAYIDSRNSLNYPLEKLLKYMLSRLRDKPVITPFLQSAIQLVKQSGCQRILLWDAIYHLPALRYYLPNCTIAFAQRHYSYPLSISHYQFCDLLITHTHGQIELAYERVESLTPYAVAIMNGVEVERFHPPSPTEKQEHRAKLGIPKESFVLIFPSRLAPEKGTYYLERWIHLCHDQHPNWHFLVVGHPQPEKTPAAFQRRLEATLKNMDNVTWIPGVSRNDMPKYYQASDICLLPAVWREGGSMSCLEAMASGVPSIASARGVFPEIIKDGYNGMLMRPHYLTQDFFNAIQILQNDQDLLDKMSRNARLYAETKLTRSKTLRNFDAFLEGRFEDIDNDLSIPSGDHIL